MKLSILIITRNRKEQIISAIKSCVKNRIDEMEVVVIDNNSHDGTRKYVEEFLIESSVEYKYYYSDSNLGVAGARNLGFKFARGQYVFSLDDDAIIETDNFFKLICDKMDNMPVCVAAAVDIYEPETKQHLTPVTFDCNNNLYYGKIALSFFGGAHILRKSFFDDKDIYPKKLMFGSEELYPSLLIHKNQKLIAYFDDLLVLHLPANIERVLGKERDLNIILNIHIIRKLYYPIIFIPILDLLFLVRILKNNLLKETTINKLKSTYANRFEEVYINRYSIKSFINLKQIFKLKNLF